MKGKQPKYKYELVIAEDDELKPEDMDFIAHTIARWIYEYTQKLNTNPILEEGETKEENATPREKNSLY